MDNLINMQRRLNYLGGNADSRLVKQKLDTFNKALLYSYQSASVAIDNMHCRVLINPDKVKQDYDDKIVSAHFDIGLKPGDIFYWEDTSTYWIIYLSQLTERAYFRGSIRKCNYQIQWVDEKGIQRSSRAAVRGPVETKIVSDLKGNISYDLPNSTLNILIPNNEHTIKVFKRYFKIMLDSLAWEVQSIDTTSMPGIIEVALKEGYSNSHKDTDDLINGKIVKTPNVLSSLDNIEEISIEQNFGLWTSFVLDGEDVGLAYEYQILKGSAEIVENNLIIHELESIEVQLRVPELDLKKNYFIQGVEEAGANVSYNIEGSFLVKPYGESTYTVRKYRDGIAMEPDGEWEVEAEGLCEITKQDVSSITLKWITRKSGRITIKYSEGDNEVVSNVIIQSLF